MSEGNRKNDGSLDDYLELLRLEAAYGISGRKDADAEKDLQFLEEHAENKTAENTGPAKTEAQKQSGFSIKQEYIPARPKKAAGNKANDTPAPPPVGKPAGKKPAKKKTLAEKIKALPKKKKIILAVIAAILAILLILGIAGGIFVSQKFGLLGDKIISDDVIYPDEIPDDINIDIGSSDFQNALREWAMNGNENKMSSKNVINVLLIGRDENGTNTDSMMLVSVNRKLKTLKLVSFFRDSYAYIDTGNGGYCNKINAAYSMGGVNCLMKTLENNYKITIDGYVMVDFESFQGLIDAMGGVKVDVQQYEADYINSYYIYHENVPAGEGVTLDGDQALQFCRVRGCDADADVSRTRRQRQVIESILNRVRSASITELNKCVDALLPYVKTSYSKGEVITLGMKAFAGGWLNYERAQIQMPPEDARTSGNEDMWIWVVDYQYAAYSLQTELYGSSNIVLEEGRTSLIDIYNGTSGSGSSSYTPAETSTVPASTEPLTTDAPEEIPTDVIQVTEEPGEEEPTEEPTEAPAEEPTEETPEETTEEVTEETPEETEAPAEETPADEETPAEE